MGSNLFKKGFEVNRENKKKQEAARNNKNKLLFDFFLPTPSGDEDNVEADVRFLTEEPINYKRHVIPEGNKYANYTCSGENCPLCARGDQPKDNGAFLLIDRREYSYKDKDGKERTGKNQIRFYTQGTRVVSQLDRLSEKYGLTNRDYTIVRLGSGTSTTYTFERGEKEEITPEEIAECMPPSIKDKYNGTMESLYDIVEEQLTMRMYGYEPEDEDEDEEDEDVSSSADSLVSVEESKPSRSGKSLFRKPQHSMKPKAKDLLK